MMACEITSKTEIAIRYFVWVFKIMCTVNGYSWKYKAKSNFKP